MSAGMVAIDRPSDAFLQFLQKFYGLTNPVWQSTNFVVYPQFFEGRKPVMYDESRVRCNRSEKVKSCLTPTMTQRSKGKDWNDSAGGIIHGTSELPARREAGPDTPLGRKNKRDFGHQNIW